MFRGASEFRVRNFIYWTGHPAIYVCWLLGCRYISVLRYTVLMSHNKDEQLSTVAILLYWFLSCLESRNVFYTYYQPCSLWSSIVCSKGWFHGSAHVQAITSGHSISLLRKNKKLAKMSLWKFYGLSKKCRNGCDISHRSSVHMYFIHYPILDHSLCGANQVRMINSTRNTNRENFCLNPLTFSVKSGLQSFSVVVDLHLFKISILIRSC